MVTEDSAKGASGASRKGASCKGLLYLSASSKKGTAQNPLCIGVTRPQDQVHEYSVGDFGPDAAKHMKALHHFKYACVGHSTYRKSEATPTSSGSESKKHAELPRCSGLEIFVEGRAPDVADAARQGHLNESSHRSNEGAPIMPRPPSTIRPPSGIAGVPPDEFGTKFIRSAGLVAGAVKKNLSHLGNSIKDMIGDIFHSDGGGPK